MVAGYISGNWCFCFENFDHCHIQTLLCNFLSITKGFERVIVHLCFFVCFFRAFFVFVLLSLCTEMFPVELR